jgi:hypothetical protein
MRERHQYDFVVRESRTTAAAAPVRLIRARAEDAGGWFAADRSVVGNRELLNHVVRTIHGQNVVNARLYD